MKQQLFLVSIDTEAPAGNDAVNNMIYCKTSNGDFGIFHIMDILDEHRIKGLFFVDIAEAWHYGEKKIKNLLLDIDKRGHDIGVHVHPDHMADSNKRFLWQYSYKEQYTIIKKCTEFYEDVLDRKPLSFRAGCYGANNDTILVLSELGYKFDMSMYYGMKKRCKIDGDYETINSIKLLPGDIYEIPVTVFKSFDLWGYKRFDKLDESMPYGEYKALINKMIKVGSVSVGSFFMHSFSFVDWRKNPDRPIFNHSNAKRINEMINYIMRNPQCKYISENDLDDLIMDIRHKNEEKEIIELFSLRYSCMRAFKITKEKMTRNI